MKRIEHDWIPTPEAAYEEEARRFYASLDEDWIPAPDDDLSGPLDRFFVGFETLAQKKKLARYYVQDCGFHLLLCRNKKPVHLWQGGSRATIDPAKLPADPKARHKRLIQVHATDDIPTIDAMLDEWPDAEFAVDSRRSKMYLIDLDAPEPARDAKDLPKDGNAAYVAFLARAGLKHTPTFEDAGKKAGSRHLAYDAKDVPSESMWQLHGLGKYALGLRGFDVKGAGYVTLPSVDNGRMSANTLRPQPITAELVRALDEFREHDRACRTERRRERRSDRSKQPREKGPNAAPEVKAERLEERIAEVLEQAESTASDEDQRKLAYLASLLKQIDPTDHRDYDDEWLPIGMAIHDHTGDSQDGLNLWTAWSGADPLYRAEAGDACVDKWESFVAGVGIGVGTLRQFVVDQGGEIPEEEIDEDLFETFDGVDERQTESSRSRADTINLASITPREAEFLWHPYVPQGMLTASDGDPGEGKTAVWLDIVARISRGEPMPLCTEAVGAGRVLLIACEDALREVIVPRLIVAGADLSMIEVLTPPWTVADVERLERVLVRLRPTLVFTDSIMSAWGGKETKGDSEVRHRLDPLAVLAERHGIAFILQRHLRKQETLKAIYAGGGSIGFVSRCRSAMIFGPMPRGEDGVKVMAHQKCNVGPLGKSLRYRIAVRPLEGFERGLPVVEWLGESNVDANEVAQWNPSSKTDALGAAKAWLIAFLQAAGKPVPPAWVLKAGREAGLNDRTIERAAKASPMVERSGSGKSARWAFRPMAGPADLEDADEE